MDNSKVAADQKAGEKESIKVPSTDVVSAKAEAQTGQAIAPTGVAAAVLAQKGKMDVRLTSLEDTIHNFIITQSESTKMQSEQNSRLTGVVEYILQRQEDMAAEQKAEKAAEAAEQKRKNDDLNRRAKSPKQLMTKDKSDLDQEAKGREQQVHELLANDQYLQ